MPPPSSREDEQIRADIAAMAGSPDDAVLVRLMRSLDGELNDDEQAQLEIDMRLHPEWYELKADLTRGTQMAQMALAANATRAAVRPPKVFQAKTHDRGLAFFAGYRQAAAIFIGIALGVAATIGAYTLWDHANQDSGLHLAGLEAPQDSEDLQQRALARSLLPLLSADYGADRRIAVDDAAAKLHGTLSIDRGFQLRQNIPCVEFLFTPRDTDAGQIDGIACQNTTGGWQIMTITANR
jgi:hypothetical protein